MTTHSRSVVCECFIDELTVINSSNGQLSLQPLNQVEDINGDIQGLIRGEPDCFLCRRIIVCEGKTEIGLLRSFDAYLFKTEGYRFAYYGVGTAYGGGGDKFFKLAKLLKKCGYDVSILMDSDIDAEEADKLEVEELGIKVFSWDSGFSIEEQIFHDFSTETAELLIQIAVDEKTIDHVIGKLNYTFTGEHKIHRIENGEIKLRDNVDISDRTSIGTLAKNKKCEWYKRIDRGQRVGDAIFKDYTELEDCGFKRTMTKLQNWVTGHES